MPLNLKLAHKGFILLATLLLSELGFLGALFFLLEQAEREARNYEEANQIVAKANGLYTIFYSAGQALALYAVTHNPAQARRYDSLASKLPVEIADLKVLLKDDRQWYPRFDRIGELSIQASNRLTMVRRDIEESGEFNLGRLRKDIQPVLGKIISELEVFAKDRERVAKEYNPESVKKMRQNVKYALALGVVLNIFGAVILMRLFTIRITQRLDVLSDNTRRLAQGQALEPIMPGADEIANLDKVFHDMADALDEAKRKEKEAEALKQEFLAMVSHDLRTPLTSVHGSMVLLSHGALGELPREAGELIGSTEREIQRLKNLVNDLLDVAKMESGKLEIVKRQILIDDIFEQAYDSLKTFAEGNRVKLEIADCDLTVQADGDRMVQVLVNLMSNAVKFSEPGSTVTVNAKNGFEFVEIEVIDTGRGIPAEFQESIFDRFKQVDAESDTRKGGTGLGLPICKMIVEQHGGKIGVRSKSGEGSTFWFTIPIQN